jgi:sec-independent protein translocase protein TatB
VFGIGFLELCVIAVAALVLLGPDKLPEFMRMLGRTLVQLRRMSNEMRQAFDAAVMEEEEKVKKKKKEITGP